MAKGWMRAMRTEDQGLHCLLQEQEGMFVRMVSWSEENVFSCELYAFRGKLIVLKKMERNAFHTLKIPNDRSKWNEVEQFVRSASYTRPLGIQSLADIVGSG